ncbi:MAG: hypothetical protein BRD43_04225 [Bacteroidetes bacterium QS_4_64_154]|nr:MAG: hypothetical protein BRD43_04225 [Bacteroidetes bacterium QS_4_64_154]
MLYFAPQNGNWTETETSPEALPPPFVEIDPDAPSVHFVGLDDESYRLTGAPVDPSADTIHTVAAIDSTLAHGHPLSAVYVRDRTLDILIPVYIDDAVMEAGETLDGLLALHTVQYDDGADAAYTYFRTSLFGGEELLLEVERGTL